MLGQLTSPGGLVQVFPADELARAATDIDIDIIAIHGLDTRSPDTWIWRDPNNLKIQINWLQDPKMLPSIVGRARIFTCDWPADMLQKSIPTTLEESAQFLLGITGKHLERNKHVGIERPVLFVASCLGGTILIKALEMDRQDDNESDGPSLKTAWALFKDKTVSTLIDYTRKPTPNLDELVRRFYDLQSERSYHVFTFWEAHETNLLSKIHLAWMFSKRALLAWYAVACVSVVTSLSLALASGALSPLGIGFPHMPIKTVHPLDYLIPTQDDDFCESMYGPAYLEHLAENHIHYCEGGSRSHMECFVTHIHDEFCVTNGVTFTTNPRKWGMDCQYRNFTVEIANDKSGKKAQELGKFRNIEDFYEYFYYTGVRMELDQWNVSTAGSAIGRDGKGNEKCDKFHNDGKITLLVKREGNHNIWHKMLELWQTMITLDALEMTNYHPPTRNPVMGKQPFLSPEARRNVQVVFKDNDIGPVDDLWPLVTGSTPIREDELEDKCLGTVIIPLAGSSSPFWDSHWKNRDCKTKFMLNPFLRRIYRIMGIEEHNRLIEDTIVTIIDRRHGTRQIHNLTSHVTHLAQIFPNITFNIVDFASLSLKDQILTARNMDVLVGVMGAGMTHILFLPEESAVAELMTPGTHYARFRNLSKMRGLGYFTTHGLTEEEWGKVQSICFVYLPAMAPLH